MKIKVRKFRTKKQAKDHRDLMVNRFSLPRMYSQQDLDDGTIVEVGSGRHVPPSEIIRENIPVVKFHSSSDSWVVEAGESEELDEELSAQLEEATQTELVEEDEAPVARGGKGFVGNEDSEAKGNQQEE